MISYYELKNKISLHILIINVFSRCQIVETTDETQIFLESLKKEWPDLLKHDFLSKTQASYFSKKKESPDVGEFIVALDFIENFTFLVQDAIQS